MCDHDTLTRPEHCHDDNEYICKGCGNYFKAGMLR